MRRTSTKRALAALFVVAGTLGAGASMASATKADPHKVTICHATASQTNGKTLFTSIGCAMCHTASFTTGPSASAALNAKPVALYSDLLVHKMGPALADDIIQGLAGPDEWRTAPLWGVGQRVFFLHDGRTRDLRVAIEAHAGVGDIRFGPSEANHVIANWLALTEAQKQDVLNFLRGL